MSNRIKIVLLWVVFFLGMTMHTFLTIMPVFWGQSITMSPEQIVAYPITPMMWMMFFFFLLPIIVIVLTLLTETKWYRITNFVFSLVFTLLNILHLAGHLGKIPVDPRLLILLTFVLISGVILNVVSFRWIKE